MNKNIETPVWLIILVVLVLLLGGVGGGYGFKIYDTLIAKNDSLINVEKLLIIKNDKLRLESADSIKKIRESRIVYVNTGLKWKKKYEELQKNYDVILHKLYPQHHLDSLADNFLFKQ
jgi:Ni2+-binding GTPase involved in maturation of urease and hydrogenase